MYNIYPEVGEINGLRNNFSMAELGVARAATRISFGECKAVIENKKFEPMNHAKGIVARTYMYMDKTYPGRGIISRKNEKLLSSWNMMCIPYLIGNAKELSL